MSTTLFSTITSVFTLYIVGLSTDHRVGLFTITVCSKSTLVLTWTTFLSLTGMLTSFPSLLIIVVLRVTSESERDSFSIVVLTFTSTLPDFWFSSFGVVTVVPKYPTWIGSVTLKVTSR